MVVLGRPALPLKAPRNKNTAYSSTGPATQCAHLNGCHMVCLAGHLLNAPPLGAKHSLLGNWDSHKLCTHLPGGSMMDTTWCAS